MICCPTSSVATTTTTSFRLEKIIAFSDNSLSLSVDCKKKFYIRFYCASAILVPLISGEIINNSVDLSYPSLSLCEFSRNISGGFLLLHWQCFSLGCTKDPVCGCRTVWDEIRRRCYPLSCIVVAPSYRIDEQYTASADRIRSCPLISPIHTHTETYIHFISCQLIG